MKKLISLALALCCLLCSVPAFAYDMNEEVVGGWYLDYIEQEDGRTVVLADYGQIMDLAVYEDGTFVEMTISFLQRANKFTGTWEAFCNQDDEWFCNFIYEFADGEEVVDAQLIDDELVLYNNLAGNVYHYVRDKKHDVQFFSGVDTEADIDSFNVETLTGAAAIGSKGDGSLVYGSMDALSLDTFIALNWEGEGGYLFMEKISDDGTQTTLEGPFEFGEDEEGYPCLLAEIETENGETPEEPITIKIYRQKLYKTYLVMGYSPMMIAVPEEAA